MKFFIDVIRRLENPQIPFPGIFCTFMAAVTLRNFLEQFSTLNPISLPLAVHYSVCYVAMALSLMILFHFASGEEIEKTARVVLPFFLILSIVPLADQLLHFGKSSVITYLRPGEHQHLLQRFFLLGGSYEGSGVTPGQRIEIVLVVILSGIYFFIKTGRLLRSIFFAFLTYAVIFSYLALPFFLKIFLNICGTPYDDTNEMMIRFYLFLILPLTQILFYLYNKKYFFAVWKDSRPLRIFYFLSMVVLGFMFFLNPAVRILALNTALRQSGVMLSWFFIAPAVIFGWLFSVMINNCEDYAIDLVSNKTRPTVSGTIPPTHYKGIALVFLILALVYAWAVSFPCFFVILLWVGNYFLYSCPPLRLKRVPFFSKMIISVNSLALFGLGFSLCSGVLIPPPVVTLFFLTCLTAAVNFIDIKDYEGDRAAGIKTLPTLLGLRKAKLIIGSFFLMTYGLLILLFNDTRLLPVLAATGIIIFCLINRKNYSEKPVLITCILSIIVLIIHLWMRSF